MELHVSLGADARTVLCGALASAQRSIEAQFHHIKDDLVFAALNAAAERGVAVTLYLEGDRGRYGHHGPHVPETDHVRAAAAEYVKDLDRRIHFVVEGDADVLEHGKAAVIDGRRAFVATANATPDGFAQPGEVLVEDDEPADVAAVSAAINGGHAQTARIASGPDPALRSRIGELLAEPRDERIAIEKLSDPSIVCALLSRHRQGLHDEVLVNIERHAPAAALELASAGVAVRAIPGAYMHEKYVDAGDRIYVGSANLTRNGLDEAREIGIIAPAADFSEGATELRNNFASMWAKAVPVEIAAP